SDVDDPQQIVNEIRAAVDGIPSFPKNSERPEVRLKTNFQSVISVAVLAPPQLDPANDPVAQRQLRDLAETIHDELLQLPEVSHVQLWQAKPYQIDVEVSEETLREYGLTHHDVARALRAGNLELPGGLIKTPQNEYLIRTTDRHLTGEGIARIPLRTDPAGTVLTVGDIATIRDGFADIDTVATLDDRPVMSIKIRMTNGQDMLKIRDQVCEFAANRPMPPGYHLKTWDDYSRQARDRLELLSRNGFYGLLLVFAVLALFLDPRLAFWVALGIPVSVFGTCAVMLAAGHTLNIYSMFAFVMALGIVVDDAIVIAENVYSHRLRGNTPLDAAIQGTTEVAPAVLSSVLTSVIAFIPLAFVTGEMGKWIAVMPLGLVAMLLISLAQGLLVLPCHLAHSKLPDSTDHVPGFQQAVQRAVDRFIDRIYSPTLQAALARPATLFASSIAALLITAGLYLGGLTPFVFNQQLDWGFVYTFIEYPRGTPTATIDDATKRLEDAFREIEQEELRLDDHQASTLVRTRFRSVGYTNQLDNMRGEIYVEFDPGRIFSRKSSREVISKWRQRAGEFPGAQRVVFWGINNSPGGRAIELDLLGSDVDELESVAADIKQHLASYDGVYDIRDSRGPGKWELKLKLKPAARSLGIRLDELARTVRGAFHGVEAMRLQRGRHEV
ncbi:MAG: efflux RND transporter permease subunit, partial [Planctomycetaceae bacterium]